MAERELELRLRGVARALDLQGPAFDLGLLPGAPRRRIRGRAVALLCVVAVAGVTAAPAAVSALRHLFDVDQVQELGPLAPGVAPPFAGRSIPVHAVQASAPFRVRMISALGTPDDARVRDDIKGGMVTVAYGGGRILLTQWRTADVHARIALVPFGGAAEDVTAGEVPALWIAGTARGTFTLHRGRRRGSSRELRGRRGRAPVEGPRNDVPPPGRRLESGCDPAGRPGGPLERL
jgi:hypothetical protein